MSPRIERIPSPVIDSLPPPVVAPTILPRPVVSGLSPPVIDIPGVVIDYPTIDVPTREEWEGVVGGETPSESPVTPTRPGLDTGTPPTPTINVGGLDVPAVDVAPLVTAGATAVVTTVVTLGATLAVGQAKQMLEPLAKKMMAPKKKKKIKIKQVKPVLHFVESAEGVEIIEYSQKGMKILESNIDNLEQYLRDQVDLDTLWELDNKLIIDDALANKMTKEGVKRFKKYFASPKIIAKKLGAKFAF